MKYCFGVDIGGTTVKMALFTENGEMLDKWEIVTHTENEGVTILSDVAESLQGKMKERDLQAADCVGVGIGVPAPVSDEGIVDGSANLGWQYKEAKKEAEELLQGIPVIVGNDANVAALGELWKGGGMGYKNLIMVTLGTGVGGGLIYNSKIINGSNGAGGEIGHIYVNYEEPDVCGCGNRGCLEQYSSATGIVRVGKQILARDERASVLRSEEVTAKSIFDGVKIGDEVACEIAKVVCEYLGFALANISAIIDPQVIVIGGGVSKAGQVVIDYVERSFQERMFFANDKVKFALATLGNDAGVYGAAKMVLD